MSSASTQANMACGSCVFFHVNGWVTPCIKRESQGLLRTQRWMPTGSGKLWKSVTRCFKQKSLNICNSFGKKAEGRMHMKFKKWQRKGRWKPKPKHSNNPFLPTKLLPRTKMQKNTGPQSWKYACLKLGNRQDHCIPKRKKGKKSEALIGLYSPWSMR